MMPKKKMFTKSKEKEKVAEVKAVPEIGGKKVKAPPTNIANLIFFILSKNSPPSIIFILQIMYSLKGRPQLLLLPAK